MRAALLGLALLLVAVTFLPYLRRPWWWVRIWDFPRPQILGAILAFALALVLLTPAGVGMTPFVLALLAAAAIDQLRHIWRYTPLGPVQVPDASAAAQPERRLRVLIANVLETNRRADDLIRVIEAASADLVLLVETDPWWDERLAPLAASFRQVLRRPLSNTYGMHLLSRLPLHDAHLRELVEPGVPSVTAEVELRSGERIAFYGLHPRPPRPYQDVEERDAELLIVGHEARADPLPAIVAGDLNDVPWSHTTRLFQRISGLLDPRAGRGLYATFPAHLPFLRWPLDHLFHDARLTLVELRRLPRCGSDHFPILVELAYEPERLAEAEIPAPAPGDRMASARAILRVFKKSGRELRARLRRLRARRGRGKGGKG